MKHKKHYPTIVVSIILIILLGIYLFKNQYVFSLIKNLHGTHIGVLILSFLAMILSNGYLNMVIIQKLNPDVTWQDIFWMQFTNNFFNKLFPKGGPLFRSYYLKSAYNLSYSHFYSTFAGIVAINIAILTIIGISSQIVVYFSSAILDPFLFGLSVLLFFGSLIIIFVSPNLEDKKGRIFKILSRIIQGWKIIQKNPKDISTFLILMLIAAFIQINIRMVVFIGLGIEITFIEGALLTSLSGILSYINFTPDGIGVREMILLYLGMVISVSGPEMVLASVVERLILFVPSAIFGILGYIILVKRIKVISSNL